MQIDKTARRIVGSLIEKRWTTPDQYPLTLNALVAACNQKSNRDPEMQLEEFIVEGCLYQMRLEGLVSVVERDTGRAVRYAERLEEKLDLSRQQEAILAELMLRGPQTAPELVRRCGRMAQFQNEGEVENLLRGMADRGWTKLLPRETGQRHQRWQHLFAPPGEEPEPSPHEATHHAVVTPIADAVHAVDVARHEDENLKLTAELAALRAEIAELRGRLAKIDGGDGGGLPPTQ
jgi:uncharacterized protein YceH (UPF0502 family)